MLKPRRNCHLGFGSPARARKIFFFEVFRGLGRLGRTFSSVSHVAVSPLALQAIEDNQHQLRASHTEAWGQVSGSSDLSKLFKAIERVFKSLQKSLTKRRHEAFTMELPPFVLLDRLPSEKRLGILTCQAFSL